VLDVVARRLAAGRAAADRAGGPSAPQVAPPGDAG
jgi:hypothetical protein